jgi:hypothetical protein
MDAKLDPHADLDRLGGDVLDPAHQPKALVAINEGDIVGGTFAQMRHRCRIDRAEPGADPPFEPIAAAKRTNDAGMKDRPVRLRAPLIDQLALVEICLIDRQR